MSDKGAEGLLLAKGRLVAKGRLALARWGRIWERPGLEEAIDVQISRRMTRSLGRAQVDRGLVRIAHPVAESSSEAFLEVLCHEVAHVVVFERFGRGVAPHGRAWTGLMQMAGYEARTRGDPAALGIAWPRVKRVRRRSRYIYEHRCARCGIRRRARRAVRQWRCSPCLEAGYDGKLEILRWLA